MDSSGISARRWACFPKASPRRARPRDSGARVPATQTTGSNQSAVDREHRSSVVPSDPEVYNGKDRGSTSCRPWIPGTRSHSAPVSSRRTSRSDSQSGRAPGFRQEPKATVRRASPTKVRYWRRTPSRGKRQRKDASPPAPLLIGEGRRNQDTLSCKERGDPPDVWRVG